MRGRGRNITSKAKMKASGKGSVSIKIRSRHGNRARSGRIPLGIELHKMSSSLDSGLPYMVPLLSRNSIPKWRPEKLECQLVPVNSIGSAYR